ncbi:hypothetical protein FJU30_13970 [Affinibrenneria salicis]|uniref:Uncharacterized protein n=1 Tax=Affinibrenneria salicis TaxID=2590031 RepID=A0A5J5FZH1_9GAMM|nr:hypothetical protein [Affinibrenneria salicis]KAA8999435.1 hypothetical protein FJU30_13970 [Affinibrenneria salicis]
MNKSLSHRLSLAGALTPAQQQALLPVLADCAARAESLCAFAAATFGADVPPVTVRLTPLRPVAGSAPETRR